MEYRGPAGRRRNFAASTAAGPQPDAASGRPASGGAGAGDNADPATGRIPRPAHAAGQNPGRIGDDAQAEHSRDLLRTTESPRRARDESGGQSAANRALANDSSLSSAPLPADILGSITTAVIGINAEGIVTYLNSGAEDLLALSARHGLGRPLQALLPQLRNLHQLVQRAAAEGQSFGQLLSFSAPRQGPEANDLAVRVSPSRTGDGNLIVELFDATQWRQIDRERALISQHDASRRMIRQLAHEIRNPLGGLRGAAQLLERELPTPELREYTRIIIGEADRLTSLTDSLLGPIRRPQWQAVNLHEILERVIVLIASEQHDAVRLVRDYDPSLPPLSADPDQLLQSFLNVARNAMQAVGPDGQIVFRTRVLSNFAIGPVRHKLVASVEIEDDGPGIPAEISDSIFYPLVTGRPDGTGLGLPISQDLVSRHGGLIEFQSRPGKTVFMVRLPIHSEVTEMP